MSLQKHLRIRQAFRKGTGQPHNLLACSGVTPPDAIVVYCALSTGKGRRSNAIERQKSSFGTCAAPARGTGAIRTYGKSTVSTKPTRMHEVYRPKNQTTAALPRISCSYLSWSRSQKGRGKGCPFLVSKGSRQTAAACGLFR